jgi:nicotinamidase-related amidase
MDLRVVVVRECCWSGDREAHAYSLDKAMPMFGRIRTLAETERLLGLPQGR